MYIYVERKIYRMLYFDKVKDCFAIFVEDGSDEAKYAKLA